MTRPWTIFMGICLVAFAGAILALVLPESIAWLGIAVSAFAVAWAFAWSILTSRRNR